MHANTYHQQPRSKKQHLEARCVHKLAIFPLNAKPAVPLPLFPTSVTMPPAAYTTLVNSEAAFQVENLTFVASPSPCPASLQPRAFPYHNQSQAVPYVLPKPSLSQQIRVLFLVLMLYMHSGNDLCSLRLIASATLGAALLSGSSCPAVFLLPAFALPHPGVLRAQNPIGRGFQRRVFCFQAAVLP